jgi:hypothetical protein
MSKDIHKLIIRAVSMKTVTNISLLIMTILLFSCATTNPEVERIRNALTKANEDFISLHCTNPEYSAFYVNTPCWAADVDFTYLSNNDKVADEAKPIVLDYFRAKNDLTDYRMSLIRQLNRSTGINNRSILDAIQTSKEEDSSNIISLYSQEITWGEFNENRLEINNRLNQRLTAVAPLPSTPQPTNPVSRTQQPAYPVSSTQPLPCVDPALYQSSQRSRRVTAGLGRIFDIDTTEVLATPRPPPCAESVSSTEPSQSIFNTNNRNEITMCADGTFVAGSSCRMAPDGTFVSGDAGRTTMCADGTFVSGSSCRMVPDGSFVNGSTGRTTMCADGTFVSGSRCRMAPDGTFVGVD